MNLLWSKDIDRDLADLQEDPNLIWVFHHVNKTAGTSIVREVSRRLCSSRCYNVYVTDDLP